MDVDTIAAVSTPPGMGGIAVVRVSGPDAVGVLSALTPGGAPTPEPRRATLRQLHDPEDGSLLDRVLVTFFSAPASYTGEDVVELACHGGWLVPELVVEACVLAGARRAEPGEFTRRAYLHGKLDLIQVEATADLIEARSRATHRAALHQLDRGLSARLTELRERIVRVEALLAHHIDFPEEDDAPVPVERIRADARGTERAIEALLATAPEGEMLREGALTVLAGRPNAGKSSLFNALLGKERAIVAAEPGTTRDALEATVQFGGFPFRLVDTAGLRDTDSPVERVGIEFAHRYLDAADVVVLCVPSDESLTDSDREFLRGVSGRRVVIVETKADLGRAAGVTDSGVESGAMSIGGRTASARVQACKVRASVVDGEGLDELRGLLPELVYSSMVASGADVPIVTRERHARALRHAGGELREFDAALGMGVPAEVAATHLRAATEALETLLGVITVDDVLDVVFKEFCVGK